ncbi:MAG: di-heme oxidoredictase family protein [Pirellulales bacterium]
MQTLRRILVVATILVLAGATALPLWAGQSNSLMDISRDGRLLACTNRDSGTVTIVDLQSHQKQAEFSVEKKPEGLTFLGASHQLAVAVYGTDQVVFWDADTAKQLGATEVYDEPYGAVSNDAGDRVFVTLDFPGRIVEIDTKTYKVVRQLDVGKFVRGIALSPNGDRIYITEFYTTIVKAIDLGSGEVVDQWKGASTDNLLRHIVLHPTRPKAYISHIRSRVTAVHGAGSIFPYVSVVDTVNGEDRRRKRIPMDGFFSILVTSNPWETAISPDGKQAFVIFGGTNDMFACTVIDDDYRELGYSKYMRLGANPRAVRVAPNGQTVYVYNALDFEVVGYDTKTFKQVAAVKISENPLSAEILAGKKLFYVALQPMVGRRWISCSSCHPDGQPDGRTWHNPEGLRNTQSLAGMAWTHPIHWSADRDEVQDFEHTIRGQLMQGRGLIRGKVHPSLEKPNKGLSASLDAVAAYSNSHTVPLSPFARGGLSESATRGRKIFLSSKTACATCHTGPFYSDSAPRTAKEIVRHDVGTGNDDPSEKMGPTFDTPTLLGVYRTAPYLHHGRAATLAEVLREQNGDDKHGVTSHLTDTQVDDLVEFLKALPFEDPVPEAIRLGLQQVAR